MYLKKISTSDLINELNRRNRELKEDDIKRYSLYIKIEKTPNYFMAGIFKENHKYSGEISEGNLLISKAGYGESVEEAKNDLLKKIRGKLLVFSAYSENREEINLV